MRASRGNRTQGKENNVCKGPEVGVCLDGLQNGRKFTMTEKNEPGEDE